MTEHNLFQEVQEDLERQKFEALWKQYGVWVALAALLVVLGTAGSNAYTSWRSGNEQRLTTGMMDAAKSDDAVKNIEALQKFADENKGTGHAELALLRAGAMAADRSDKATAIRFFDEVATDGKADPTFRQLGDLLSVQAQLDSGEPTVLSSRLQPLTEEHATWRYSALEAQGYLAMRAGDMAKAKRIFTDLSQDARAPQTIAARATDILRSLN